jgi:hypothetical protein
MKFFDLDLVFVVFKSNHMAIFDANNGQLKKMRFMKRLQKKLDQLKLLHHRLKFCKDLTS